MRNGFPSLGGPQTRQPARRSSTGGQRRTVAGGRIEVDLSVTHDRVELVVLDTGIGIGVRDRIHVVSRFFRTRLAAQWSIQGVGLGLSISKAIVDSHGGRIEVESEEGRSTFRVWLLLDEPVAVV